MKYIKHNIFILVLLLPFIIDANDFELSINTSIEVKMVKPNPCTYNGN